MMELNVTELKEKTEEYYSSGSSVEGTCIAYAYTNQNTQDYV